MYSNYNVKINNNNEIILFNTLTKALVVLKDEEHENLKAEDFTLFSEEQVQYLSEAGFIFENQWVEESIAKHIMNKEKYNAKVLSITVYLTYRCNFDCVYCYEKAEDKKGDLNDFMLNNMIDWISWYIDRNDYEILNLTLYGGEPLLVFDRLKTVCKKFKELCLSKNLNLETVLITNGYLLSKDVFKSLKKYNLNLVQITIDGPREVHNFYRPLVSGKGTYNNILNNLIKNTDDDTKILVRVNVEDENIKNVYSLIDDLKTKNVIDKKNLFMNIAKIISEKEVKNGKVLYRKNDMSLDEEIIKIYKYAIDNGIKISNYFNSIACDATNLNNFHIDPLGDIYTCSFMVGIRRLSIGNIHIKKVNNLYYLLSNSEASDKDCVTCSYYPVCKGGCRVLFNLKEDPLIEILNKKRCNIHQYCNFNKELLKVIVTQYID